MASVVGPGTTVAVGKVVAVAEEFEVTEDELACARIGEADPIVVTIAPLAVR